MELVDARATILSLEKVDSYWCGASRAASVAWRGILHEDSVASFSCRKGFRRLALKSLFFRS